MFGTYKNKVAPPPPPAQPAERRPTDKLLLELMNLSFDRLLEAKKFLDAEVAKRSVEEIDATKSKLSAMASSLGVSLGSLFGISSEAKKEKKKRKQRETKTYVNPDNPQETYRGFGKRPAWLQARLDAGEEMETFRVKEQS